jgi:hypothetical protein
MTALSAMVTDVAEGPGSEVDAAASPPARKLSPADLAALDHCELGAHRCLSLTPDSHELNCSQNIVHTWSYIQANAPLQACSW